MSGGTGARRWPRYALRSFTAATGTGIIVTVLAVTATTGPALLEASRLPEPTAFVLAAALLIVGLDLIQAGLTGRQPNIVTPLLLAACLLGCAAALYLAT